MNWKPTLFTVLLINLITFVYGQNSCEYRLQLFDTFGDGWAGAAVEVTIGSDTESYTLDGENDNGAFRQFNISATDGDTIIITYTAGSFDIDNAFTLLNPEGIVLYTDERFPEVGEVFNGSVFCPQCFVANPNTVNIDDVRAFSASIRWLPPDSNNIYEIEYGTQGFITGTGNIVTTANTQINLTELDENTAYDFYLTVICEDESRSTTIGPFSFTTRWAVDLTLAGIVGPETACLLTSRDSVKVILKNLGGNPQSLIPFRYSVNGTDAGVNIPFDGFYTDVLGKDSMVTVAFETLFDLTAPGEYEIIAWTEVEGDSDTSNDTAIVNIVNVPEITDYPYFEDFEQWIGGWTIDPASENATWQRGRPQGNTIRNATSGSNAYVTNLSGNYDTLEVSYLLSPCLDFSSLDEDPIIAFALNIITEDQLDNAWLEVSIDGGEVWEKVGSEGTGLNWYNDPDADTWTGDGGFEDWRIAFNSLSGTAGQPEVRLRFVLESDFATQLEGIGIDDIFIAEPSRRDLAGVSVVNQANPNCGAVNDRVVFTITNLGTQPQSGFQVSYQVNEGEIISDIVNNITLQPGAQVDYTFNSPFNSSEPGTYEIVAWTDLNNDAFNRTDTASFRFTTISEIPYSEDFEAGILPLEWTTDEEAIVANEHGNTSFVLFNNMWSGDPSFVAESPQLGIIQNNDSLVFDYRIVDFLGDGNTATNLGANDNIIVQISTDCGETYETVFVIDNNNHLPSTNLQQVNIPLGAYVGQYIRVRFIATWGEGDYFVDIDNFNIPRCSGDLGLVAEVVDATGEGAMDGRISVTPTKGVMPYTFNWNTGATTSTLTNLSPQLYQVTVTDRFGCAETADFSLVVSTEDEIETLDFLEIYPNPTSDIITLSIGFTSRADLRAEVFNLMGQQIFHTVEDAVQQVTIPVDLSSQPSGIYLLRIWSDQQFLTRQVVKSR